MDDARWKRSGSSDEYIAIWVPPAPVDHLDFEELPTALEAAIREPLESRLAELEAAIQDVLGKMKPAPGRPAYREIHARHLRRLSGHREGVES